MLKHIIISPQQCVSIGNAWPIHEAYALVRDPNKRNDWFLFFEEIIRQGYSGDTVHIFVEQLVDTHEPEAVLERLRTLAGQRRDLWQVRVAILQQLVSQEAYDEALSESQVIIDEFLASATVFRTCAGSEAARRPDLEEEALLGASACTELGPKCAASQCLKWTDKIIARQKEFYCKP